MTDPRPPFTSASSAPFVPSTPEANSQARLKRAEREALRGLQDMHRAAWRGEPLASPHVAKTLARLAEAGQMRDAHSHRYYRAPDPGHQYQIDLLDRTYWETVNFFAGRGRDLAATAKALRKHTAPLSPAALPPPGVGVPPVTRLAPDRVARLLFRSYPSGR